MVSDSRLLVGAIFRETAERDLDGVILRNRPETVVKKPIGLVAYPRACSMSLFRESAN